MKLFQNAGCILVAIKSKVKVVERLNRNEYIVDYDLHKMAIDLAKILGQLHGEEVGKQAGRF